MKKLLSILLTLALIAALTVSVFAMQIFIEITVATESEYITLDVEPTDRIEDVKEKIFEKTGIAVSRQILTFAGKTLEEGNTLQDYSIHKDSVIRLSTPPSTIVTYSVAPSYTVTIPTDVTIGTEGTEKTVSAEGVVVKKGQYVSVSLAADNDFTVSTPEGATLTYTVTANGAAIAPGDEILAVNPEEGKTGAAAIVFSIDESAIRYAGIYTGTATFTVAVKEAPDSND